MTENWRHGPNLNTTSSLSRKSLNLLWLLLLFWWRVEAVRQWGWCWWWLWWWAWMRTSCLEKRRSENESLVIDILAGILFPPSALAFPPLLSPKSSGTQREGERRHQRMMERKYSHMFQETRPKKLCGRGRNEGPINQSWWGRGLHLCFFPFLASSLILFFFFFSCLVTSLLC